MSDFKCAPVATLLLKLTIALHIVAFITYSSSRGEKKIGKLTLFLNLCSPPISILNSLHFKTSYEDCFDFSLNIVLSFIVFSGILGYSLNSLVDDFERKYWFQKVPNSVLLSIYLLIYVTYLVCKLLGHGEKKTNFWRYNLGNGFTRSLVSLSFILKENDVLSIFTAISLQLDPILNSIDQAKNSTAYNYWVMTNFAFKMYIIASIVLIAIYNCSCLRLFNYDPLYKIE